MKCVPNDIFWIPNPSLVYNQPSAAREREIDRAMSRKKFSSKLITM